MILVSKVLLLFLLPPGGCLALLAIGLGLLAARRRAAGLGVIAFAWVALALLSAPRVAQWLAAPIEARFEAIEPEAAPHADAIVVLGGGAGPPLPPRLDPDLGNTSDRVWLGARLFAAGAAARVVVSGGRTADDPRSPSEAHSMARLLELWGVPASAIEQEDASRNTRENCAAIADLAVREGWRRILLVTSALHMPRALAACERRELEIVAVPTDFRAVYQGSQGALGWLPDPDALGLSSAALKEYLALTLSRAAGWLRGSLSLVARPMQDNDASTSFA